MPSLLKAMKSQVGRKIITGITGIGLMLFLIGHIVGNLSIFGAPNAFNLYTKTLTDLGPLLYVIEAGLAFFFIYHAVLGFSIWKNRRKVRPASYKLHKSKGGPSHMNLASKSMMITGIIILVFVILHVIHFKFGAEYVVEGSGIRDLRKLVIEEFQKAWVVIGYVAVLGLMTLHLAHGFWSAFTSLGMQNKSTSKRMQMIGYGFSIILMLAFIFIPLYIFITSGNGSLISH